MAHFAELDENNIVTRVIVVADEDTAIDDGSEDGQEDEALGVSFCNDLLGGDWVQTSYNGAIRQKLAAVGDMYYSDRDAFVPPSPFPSWVLLPNEYRYSPPVPLPEDSDTVGYDWDEPSQAWIAV